MNEVLDFHKSAYFNQISGAKEVINLITGKMLELRPRTEVELKPFLEQKHIYQKFMSGPVAVDFRDLIRDAYEGDIAYAAARIKAEYDMEAVFTIQGDVKLWLNGSVLLTQLNGNSNPSSYIVENEKAIIPVCLKQGWNEILVKSINYRGNWGFELVVGFPRYPHLWARDYLMSVRATFPFDEMEGLEGFAWIGPFKNTGFQETAEEQIFNLDTPLVIENNGISYTGEYYSESNRLQWLPRFLKEEDESQFDYRQLFGDMNACAYALTYCDSEKYPEAVLDISYSCPIKIFIDGNQVFSSSIGGFTSIPVNSSKTFHEILVKCANEQGGWNFSGHIHSGTDRNINRIPFIQEVKGKSVKWICVGPFRLITDNVNSENLLDIPFAPELKVQFNRPYPLGDYSEAFWRLKTPDIYIRPYMDGIFFGQWFYAVQVGLYGLFVASKKLGNKEYCSYFIDSMSVMAEYYDYARWDRKRFINPTLIPRSCELKELDPCGTIGVAMIEAYLQSGNEKLLPVIRRIGEAVMNDIPRFNDGTFYRIHTMWADDLYMSCPFLIRMGCLTGEQKYFTEVYKQVRGFHTRLWMEDKNLYSHIYFTKEAQPNRVPWGRGNGWIAVTLTEILLHLPENEEKRDEILDKFREFSKGIVSVQDKSGMWHQVLDKTESYEETSCTAMFVLSLARGVKYGWLDNSYFVPIKKGWEALLKKCIDLDGNTYGVCLGSGCSMEGKYYYDIPTHQNDDHGTGIILLAASEVMDLDL
jgi:rhamnogalacturonyl hydrolase YesR